MHYSRQRMFNVWLIAAGKAGEDLEEALRMNSLGHNLTVFPDTAAFEQRSAELDRDSRLFPHLLMYLVGDVSAGGTDFLRGLKASADYRHVPVIIFHSDPARLNVKTLYTLGAASVIRVPIGFQGLVEIMRTIEAYWSTVVSPSRLGGTLYRKTVSE